MSSTRGASAGLNHPLLRRDQLIRERLAALTADTLVLNIGCGTLRRFESECPGRYLGTDLRHLPSVDFVADATALPVADGCADVVIALELLEHVPRPAHALSEFARILRPGGTVVVSVPSTVPRHDEHDYWRFTAQGLGLLCDEAFPEGAVTVFGGTFETIGNLAAYYIALVTHRMRVPSRRFRRMFSAGGRWVDRHLSWSTSTTALHTLAFDLVFIGTTRPEPTATATATARSGPDLRSG